MLTAAESLEPNRSTRLTPAELAELDHPTPYLLMDLDAVDGAYRTIADALPGVAIRYAVKCNPDERILRRLHAAGSAFEIASYPELQLLGRLGVRAEDVIFSSPVKPWEHIREAAQGDRVYIYTAGAYTTCYASTFNGFRAPATHCLPEPAVPGRERLGP